MDPGGPWWTLMDALRCKLRLGIVTIGARANVRVRLASRQFLREARNVASSGNLRFVAETDSWWARGLGLSESRRVQVVTATPGP